jgi:hypothetical protein
MTKLLEEAIKKAKEMPEKEQNDIAAFILDEVAWDNAIDQSKDKLAALANKALHEHKSGQTKDMTF